MKHRNTAFTLVFLIFGIQSATASNFSFTGNFNQDDEVKFFTFSIASALPTDVTLQTLSFSGGKNAVGDIIPGGGFAPYLHLWDSIGTDLSGVEPSPNGDAIYKVFALSAGSYIVALTENNNKAFGDLPGGVLDPTRFTRSGEGNFTGSDYSCGLGGFWDVGCKNQRTSAWALDIKSVDSAQAVASIPLPGTFSLAAAGLAVFWPFVRRRKASGH